MPSDAHGILFEGLCVGVCFERAHSTTRHRVTAASSGTHTRWCRKQASGFVLSGAPVAAGQASSLALWRARLRVREATGGEPQRYRRGLRDATSNLHALACEMKNEKGVLKGGLCA